MKVAFNLVIIEAHDVADFAVIFRKLLVTLTL